MIPAASLATDPLVYLNSGALLLALGLLLLVTARLELSAIPFFLLVGLALGEGGVLPVGVSTEIASLGAGIGLLLLLLMLGLDFSAQELVESVRRRRTAGVVDLVLNAAPRGGHRLAAGVGHRRGGDPRGCHVHLVLGDHRPAAAGVPVAA